MAYAGYADIDPRLLAEDRGSYGESLDAIGEGVVGAVKALTEQKEKERKLAKEKKDQAWLDYERQVIVQNNFDSNQRIMSLHARLRKSGVDSKGPAEMALPPGFSEKDGKILIDEQVTNAVNGLKKMSTSQILRRQKRNRKRSSRGADPLSYREGDLDVQGADGNLVVDYEENNEVIVEKPEVEETPEGPQSVILKEIQGQDPNGKYGLKDFTYATEKEILDYLDDYNKVNGNIGLLKKGVSTITTKLKYDAAANTRISSLQTASENNGIHVVYRGANDSQQYSWYNETDKKWEFINSEGLFKEDGTINVNILTGGEDIVYTVDKIDVESYLDEDDVTKPLLKDLRDEKYVSPGEKKAIENTLIRKFSDDKQYLESFVRNNAGFKDPTPKTPATPQDAAAWYMGYMSESEVFEKGWNAPKPYVEPKDPVYNAYNDFDDIVGDIKRSILGGDTTFFSTRGIEEPVIDKEANTLTYEKKVFRRSEGNLLGQGKGDIEINKTTGKPIEDRETVTIKNDEAGRNELANYIINNISETKRRDALKAVYSERSSALVQKANLEADTLKAINPVLPKGHTIKNGEELDANGVAVGKAKVPLPVSEALATYGVKEMVKLPQAIQESLLTREIKAGRYNIDNVLKAYNVTDRKNLPKAIKILTYKLLK